MTTRTAISLAFLTISLAASAHAEDPSRPLHLCRGNRILVLPFTDGTGSRSQQYFSLALAATVAERLENSGGVDVVSGPFLLTEEAVSTAAPDGIDLAKAGALARAKHADRFITGRYAGRHESWTVTIDVYRVDERGPVIEASGTSSGSIMGNVTGRDGRQLPVVSTAAIHGLLAAAIEDVSIGTFAIPDGVAGAVRAPSTADSYAYLLLGRAYGKRLRGEQDSEGPAIATAAHAVQVDPKYVDARRFYAILLMEEGYPKKARIHFEAALAERPNDVRTLVALGKLEIEQRDPVAATDHLSRAARLRPNDADAFYWLGRARRTAEHEDDAIAAFESAAVLDPSDIRARTELAELYSKRERYADAATMLDAVTSAARNDRAARFALAATLRAAKDLDRAVATYEEASRDFPDEPRFDKFRGDILTARGMPADARAAYRKASERTRRDQRLERILADTDDAGTEALPLGGMELAAAVRRSGPDADTLERSREKFQRAANNAVLDLTLRGASECRKAAAAYAVAKAIGNEYASDRSAFVTLSSSIADARTRGEWPVLTIDEIARADRATTYVADTDRDIAEMLSALRGVRGLLAQYRCRADDDPPDGAEAEAVMGDAHRDVTLPEIQPPRYASVIAPEVPSDPARIIRYTIRNETAAEYEVTVDDDRARKGIVPPGKSVTLAARVGTHLLCVAPKGRPCEPGTMRSVFLHDQWTMTVKPGRTPAPTP